MAKPFWSPGNVVEIRLQQSTYCYGIVLSAPLMGFFDIRADAPLQLEALRDRQILFKIWVMKSAIGKNGWKVIGQPPLSDAMKVSPWFFKQDRLSSKITRYRHPEEVPATKDECEGLECAAVWSRVHVESRLIDHFEGRPNKWVESMALK